MNFASFHVLFNPFAELPTIPFFPELFCFLIPIKFFFHKILFFIYYFFFFLHNARQTTALICYFDHKFNRKLRLKHTWREKYSQKEALELCRAWL